MNSICIKGIVNIKLNIEALNIRENTDWKLCLNYWKPRRHFESIWKGIWPDMNKWNFKIETLLKFFDYITCRQFSRFCLTIFWRSASNLKLFSILKLLVGFCCNMQLLERLDFKVLFALVGSVELWFFETGNALELIQILCV